MAQKKVKKSKAEKPKKAAKPAPKKPVAAVLKKAAKAVAKKVSSALVAGSGKKKLAAKPAPKAVVAKKNAAKAPAIKAGKPEKPEKKVFAKPAPVAAEKATAAKKKENGKKAVPAKTNGKKAEVILEVPAPKGVALLSREGKKKAKAELAALARKNRCREPGCEHEMSLSGFCRLHYIKNWRKIKRKEAILASGQLNNYVEELVSKYPDKYLDVIRQDLASEKEWVKVVEDLELESPEEEAGGDEDMEGVAEGPRRERDFDDDNDTF